MKKTHWQSSIQHHSQQLLEKFSSLFKQSKTLFGLEPTAATFDEKTHEAGLAIARLIDDFFSRLLESKEPRQRHDLFREDYRTIEVELRSLLLRNESRPRNDISVKMVQILLGQWTRLKSQHQKSNQFSPAFIEEMRSLVNECFKKFLILEAHKIRET